MTDDTQTPRDPERNRLSGRIARSARVGANLSGAGLTFATQSLFGGDQGDEKIARALAAALGKSKGPLMKVAQMVSTIPDFLPPEYAAEMVAYDTLVGEFRVHYAGFFDPGFGFGAGGASRAVLEVRSYEVPFLLEDGQTVGQLVYERLTDVPDKIYGKGLGSSYQKQGLKLSRHFRDWPG